METSPVETALTKCLRIPTRRGEFDFCSHSYSVNLEKLRNLFYFIKWKRHTIFNIQVGWLPVLVYPTHLKLSWLKSRSSTTPQSETLQVILQQSSEELTRA